MRQNLTPNEALELLLAHAEPIGALEEVPLEAALGRVLGADLAARVDHPDCDNTAVDGYAARAADTQGATRERPVRLRLIGEAPAGRPFPGRVGPGEAVAVYTGAPLPEGADAVVRVEETARDGDTVLLYAPASAKDIRPRAEDLEQGQVYLRKGEVLSPGKVGLAAAMGYPRLPVVRRPRVGLLVTGDEVVEPGEALPYGGVYNANRYAIGALVREAGGEVVYLGKAGDDREALKARLASAGRLDLLLTSGGVSMGAYDLVRRLLEEEGRVHFWRVLIRPGGPLLFGEWRGVPLLGLPGNPVSSMVTFFLFGRPFLFRLLGRVDAPHQRVRAVAETPFKSAGTRTAFWRGVLEYAPASPGGFRVRSVGNQSSGVLRSMSEANALVVVPPGRAVAAGEVVEAILLRAGL